MQSAEVRGKMITVKDGWVICPRCDRQRVLRVLPSTRATDLVVYCKHCRSESLISLEPEPERLRR